MPREWHDWHGVTAIADEEKQAFYKSIVAEKKPYFFRYIYSAHSREWSEYIDNSNRSAIREFGMPVSEISKKSYSTMTEREREFLYHYEMHKPLGDGPCVMNKICRRFEDEFDSTTERRKILAPFDISSIGEESKCDARTRHDLKKQCDIYRKRMKTLMVANRYERFEDGELQKRVAMIISDFMRACTIVCPNANELCDAMIDFRCEGQITEKQFWALCGETAVERLLRKNDYMMSYPYRCDDGEIEFGGCRYSVKTFRQEGIYDDCVE